MVKGYKVFNSDWTCRDKQYTCPGKFEEEGPLEICGHGMHFCQNIMDCFEYYDFCSSYKVAEVVAYGEVITAEDKSCTNKLEIVREIPWNELLQIVNMGKNCTGRYNTGNHNAGNGNTGDYNTGNNNTGNIGDWNKSSFNTGCFNTKEQKIMLFNKLSNMTYHEWLKSNARWLLDQMPKKVEWVYKNNMTDVEKAICPTCETTGGYLKVFDEFESRQKWWDNLTMDEQEIIKNIPNFDPDIFYECTHIRVE